jgi:hypothetical protein
MMKNKTYRQPWLLGLAAWLCLGTPVRADEGYVQIRNLTAARWTLKTRTLTRENDPRVKAILVDLAAARPMPCKVEGGQEKPGYWDLEGGKTYCLTLLSESLIDFSFGLGDGNRNYRVFQVVKTTREGEPPVEVNFASSYYLAFQAKPMAPIGENQADATVVPESGNAVAIRGEQYKTLK